MTVEQTGQTSEMAELTRGQQLWQKVRDARETAVISLWRAKLMTASFKETEGLPPAIRLGTAFERVITQIPIYIDDEQLLVGDPAAKTSAAELHPENAVDWARRELQAGRPPVGLNQEEVAEFKEIVDYWTGRSLRDVFFAYLGDEEKKRLEGMADTGARVFLAFSQMTRAKGWYSPNYEKAIKLGLLGILAEVESELKATPALDDSSREKIYLLKGLTIELKAAIKYGKRYAELARELAEKAEGSRKTELEAIARVCDRVPAHPARTFHEALQTLWFVHVLAEYDSGLIGWSPGRVDQYLFPYYEQDIAEGRLTKEEAISLLECIRVKMSAKRDYVNVYSHVNSAGEGLFHNCTLGGQKSDGSDATNELSFLWLEAAFRVQSPHPTLSVRWHEKINQEFALRAAELSRLGLGFPAWFSDKSTIKYLTGPDMGATPEDALDYQLSGCILHTIPHKTPATTPMLVSMAKIFELALYDGYDPATGIQVGPHTGDFEDMQTWAELLAAIQEQTRYFVGEAARFLNELRLFRSWMLPQVWGTAFFDDCIKRGQDPHGGGCRYQGSGMYVLPVGLMDMVDALAAVKKVVFEDGRLTKDEVISALGANFEGYEDERRVLLASPKYGNDDEYVDNIAVDMYKFLVDLCAQTEACYGAKYVCAPHSINLQGDLGKRVGALPSGRLNGVSLADGGVSPCQGIDVNGPTAAINSAGRIDHIPIFGTLFNMKFHPSALTTREDLIKLLDLIKIYLDVYEGKHIQFNVVSKETLLEAQAHPEAHRNLVVRVAGYSALWVELERVLQDEIIARMEKAW